MWRAVASVDNYLSVFIGFIAVNLRPFNLSVPQSGGPDKMTPKGAIDECYCKAPTVQCLRQVGSGIPPTERRRGYDMSDFVSGFGGDTNTVALDITGAKRLKQL